MTETNLRTQRTKIFIQNALIELTERQGFDTISVEDISKKAMINRATFYRYYKNKYHLVEDLYKGAFRKLSNDMGRPIALRDVFIRGAPRKVEDERFQAAWTKLFEHFASNSRLYAAMLSDKGSAWFQARMREQMAKFFQAWHRAQGKQARRTAEHVPADIGQTLLASTVIGILSCWLEGEMEYSAFEAAGWFRRIAREGYVRVLGWV